MDRKEIKELAKTKIKGNIWNLFWPMLVIGLISGVLSRFTGTTTYDVTTQTFKTNQTPVQTLLSLVVPLITAVITAGYLKYILDFVRSGKLETNSIINTIKEKWLNILIVSIVGGILISIGCVLCIVPGIILALMFAFSTFLVIDSDISGIDALKKSTEMMKGYKADYFMFALSFIGWFILGICTCCIAFIWVVPYYYVANTIYFEKLKEKTTK